MTILNTIYGTSLALLTDLYQLTMAQGYWKCGKADREAVFHLFYRHNPFGNGYSIAGGLQYVIEYLQDLRFHDTDLQYLAALEGNDRKPLFEPGFLDYLGKLHFGLSLDAVPEGTVVFAHEPLVRVQGPLLQCQLIETPLLNMINFQTLIATKAARICLATRGEPVLEFGLRRAQGVDGALTAARAAYLGGCAGTSNVMAGKLFGIPVRGTHAHSWVMSFDNELKAFKAYARTMPNNCVFLVDTYDSLEGIRRAVEVGRWLRTRGHEMVGIRLDSGDLARLSIKARQILDRAGFKDASIVASNNLDEHIISSLKDQGARINVWGVGTRLSTAFDQPALGGVYKLTAIQNNGGEWQHKLKLSEQTIKINNPGILQVRRFNRGGSPEADVIWDELLGIESPVELVDLLDPTRRRTMPTETDYQDLLVPIFKRGELVYDLPPLDHSHRFAKEQLSRLPPGIKRFLNPAEHPCGLEKNLYDLKTRLVLKARRSVAG